MNLKKIHIPLRLFGHWVFLTRAGKKLGFVATRSMAMERDTR